MKARELQKYLNTSRTVHETKDNICVASAICHKLITIDKKTLKLKYALDAFNEGRESLKDDELLSIWDKLQGLIDSGKIKYYIDGVDKIDKKLPVYWCDNGILKEDFTEKYGWPNVTQSGELMYDNTHFKTSREAIKSGLKDMALCMKFSREIINQKQNEICDECRRIKYYKEKIKTLKFEAKK